MKIQFLKINLSLLVTIHLLSLASSVPLVYDITYPHPGFVHPYCSVQIPDQPTTFFMGFSITAEASSFMIILKDFTSPDYTINILKSLRASKAAVAPGIPIIFSQVGTTLQLSKMNPKYTGITEPTTVKDQDVADCSNPLNIPKTVYVLYSHIKDPTNIPGSHKLFRIDASDLSETVYPITQGSYYIGVQESGHYVVGGYIKDFVITDYTKTSSLAIKVFNKASADSYVVDTFDTGTIFATGNYATTTFQTFDYLTEALDASVVLPVLTNIRYVKVIKGTQLTFASGSYKILYIVDRVSASVTSTYTYAAGLGDTISLAFTFVEGRRQALLPITDAQFSALVTFPEMPCHWTCGGCDKVTTVLGCTSCAQAGFELKSNGSCGCPKGEFEVLQGPKSRICQKCDSNCHTCSETNTTCTQCIGEGVVLTDEKKCIVQKLDYTATYNKITKVVQVKFEYKIKLKGLIEDFKIAISDSATSEDIEVVEVSQFLDDRVDFKIEIRNQVLNKTLEIRPFSLSFPPIYKILEDSNLVPFTSYPIKVDVQNQYSTRLEDFMSVSQPYAVPTFGAITILGISFHPMLIVYLFKFMQILDYLSILGLDIPQNLRAFLRLLNQDPLDFVPQIFIYPEEETLVCSIDPGIIDAEFSCSPFMNLFKYNYIFIFFLAVILVRFILMNILRKDKKKPSGIEGENKESYIPERRKISLLQSFIASLMFLTSLNCFSVVLFLFQADFMASFFVSVFSGNEHLFLLDYISLFIAVIFFLLNILMIVTVFFFNLISTIPRTIKILKNLLNQLFLFSIIQEYKTQPVFSRQYITLVMIRDTLCPLMIVAFNSSIYLQMLPLFGTNFALLVFIIIFRPLIKRVLLVEELVGFVIYLVILGLLTVVHIWKDSFTQATQYYFFGNVIIFLILLQFGIFVVFLIVNGGLAIKSFLNNYQADIKDEEDGATDVLEQENLIEKENENFSRVFPKEAQKMKLKDIKEEGGPNQNRTQMVSLKRVKALDREDSLENDIANVNDVMNTLPTPKIIEKKMGIKDEEEEEEKKPPAGTGGILKNNQVSTSKNKVKSLKEVFNRTPISIKRRIGPPPKNKSTKKF